MAEFFRGKKILVTGGTGSVGIELVETLLQHEPAVVRVLDLDETRQFDMGHCLGRHAGKLRFLLGDIRDYDRMKRAMEGIDIVFHCAALKHVMSCEYNPFEAVKTNIIGTQNVIEAALENNVEKVILTSSDKAVNPTNVMGSTKLVAEKLMTSANYYRGNKRTVFASVRFGNVIASRGSVVPLFAGQIRKGGPVTVHHKQMTRFVMSAAQTLSLLFMATEKALGGEVFILKMPVLGVPDLAEAMIEKFAPASGHNPSEIKIQFTTPLAGEKMHEELLTEEESGRALEGEWMFVLLSDMKELVQLMLERIARDTGKDCAKIDVAHATETLLKYYNAKKAAVRRYSSGDEQKLGRHEILKLLDNVHIT